MIRLASSASTLDLQLDTATRTFIGGGRNVAVNPIGHEVWLSSIKFYTEDFLTHAPSLVAYVHRYGAFRVISRFGFSTTTGPSMTAADKERSEGE
jgi:hypothetical protein